jgi:hypothetical protein
MNSEKLTDAEIRALGWQALVDALGPSGALRFALQTERGYGDYGELRHQMLGALSVDELLKRMRKDERASRSTGRARQETTRKAPRLRTPRRPP